MSLDAVVVLPLSSSELDCFSLGTMSVSHDAVASECAWLAWYSVFRGAILGPPGAFLGPSGLP